MTDRAINAFGAAISGTNSYGTKSLGDSEYSGYKQPADRTSGTGSQPINPDVAKDHETAAQIEGYALLLDAGNSAGNEFFNGLNTVQVIHWKQGDRSGWYVLDPRTGQPLPPHLGQAIVKAWGENQ